MKPMLIAMPVFLLTIAIEAWIARRKGRAVYDIADAVTSLQLGVLQQLMGMFLVGAAWVGIYLAVYKGFRAAELPVDIAWVWLLALIAYDFCAYWAHRLDHEVNILWASHVVHHSSEYYNLSTALRQSSTTLFLHWVFYIPLAVIGIPPAVFFTVSLINLLYQYWVHTELVGKLGWLDRVLVTPSNHRVHHGQNDYCIDRNYGGMLILWDRLFGTFAEEREGEKIVYGIRKPLRSFDPVWGNLHTFAALWRESVSASGWRAKLGVWLAPPAGWAVERDSGFDAAGFTRHASPVSSRLRWYVAAHYLLTTLFLMHLMSVFRELTLVSQGFYALVIVAGVQSMAALNEGRSWAFRGEQLRLLVLAAAFAAAPDWFGFVAPDGMKPLVVVLLLGSAAWLERDDMRSPAGVAA